MRLRRILLGLALAFCAAAPVVAAEPLKVGVDPENPPWEFRDADGRLQGFEVDLVKDIAHRLSTTVEFQDFVLQALFPGVSSGQIDLAISSITIRRERLGDQAFTQPYFDRDGAILTEIGSPVDSIGDLKGKTVGVIAASSGEAWLEKNAASVGAAEIRTYNTPDSLMFDLKAERIAAGIGDVAGFQYAIRTTPGYRIAARIPTGEHFAVMLKKGSPLLQPVNDAISAMKKDGMLAAIHKKWFRVTAKPDTSTLTVLPLPTP